MSDRGCANSGPGLGVPEMTWTDRPGFSLCAAPLESLGPGFWGAWQGGRGRSRSLEYSRLERDGEDLDKEGQDLVTNLVDP